MSSLMDQAITKARQLPEADQDAIASIILLEIESEERWEKLFSHPKSLDMLSKMADEAIEELRAGRTKKLDVNEL